MSKNKHDSIYATERPREDFVFDEKVAAVFTDMIGRSVPGYATIISMIGVLANRYCTKGSNLYDLGCSLGGATLAMAHHINHQDYQLMAVENSEAMISRLRSTLDKSEERYPIVLSQADITNIEIRDASVVVLNFTLQFIAPAQREALMGKIYSGMREGGILILSEKIRLADEDLNTLLIDMYHQFKEAQGYSKLEISQKRSALENVLIPETLAEHKTRLHNAGFHSVDSWFQCFNFASMIAFK